MFVTKGTEKMERSEIGNEMARMYGEGRKRERRSKRTRELGIRKKKRPRRNVGGRKGNERIQGETRETIMPSWAEEE